MALMSGDYAASLVLVEIKYPNVQESDIKQWFNKAIEAREIKKSNSIEYGNLYYLVQNT